MTMDSPVTELDTDLGWVDFSSSPSCERRHPACDRIATHRAFWVPDEVVEGRACMCGPHATLLCTQCFEWLSQARPLGAFIACGKCLDETGEDYFKELASSERLR